MTEERRQALTRRVNILAEWLHRTDYSVYENDESLINLSRVSGIIIWALQNTLPSVAWQQIEDELMDAKRALSGNAQTEEEKKKSFYVALTIIESAISSYLEYLNK